ncbi:S8 family peptidase [Oryzomonas japonica]|uniref:S8 family peptidase n=1 Tax=Oryzomonas japonica TaxID=2603858 RepID=A0A7J4ZMQ0_9BACT|nr:S8 family peptidase [Oryzomonas japonica]KAB0664015.1 S8 family peptidase [Oryzomonas japonica]
MTEQHTPNLPHLVLTGTAHTELYTSVLSGGTTHKHPVRDRQQHGQFLLAKLERIKEEAEEVGREQTAFGIDSGNGIYLQFESAPDFELKLESLESVRDGIELVAVKLVDRRMLATCFVPEGKLDHFFKAFNDYLEKETEKKGKPVNQPLVDSISDMRKAVVDALWTDDTTLFPVDDEEIWWEVWLRVGSDREAFTSFFREHAQKLGLELGREIKFPERTVVAAKGTKAQIARSVTLLNCIAELRRAKETADFFTTMGTVEQFKWIDDALRLIEPPAKDSPAVCLLDTGVNNGHPLLAVGLDPGDMDAYEPTWGVTDHKGHGTEMAGLALYGDLTEMLATRDPIQLAHRLESVKVLPPFGENRPDLYGAITEEAVARAEVFAPFRRRVLNLAISTNGKDQGKPSSWSAAIDKLSSGYDDDERRLVVVAAGNTAFENRHLYPDSNMTDCVQDPGQSWNALTIGAFTEKCSINEAEYPAWQPVASYGDLSPCSCTSMDWEGGWPAKPDLVMEGGNMATNPETGLADHIDTLDILTTGRNFTTKPLVTTGDTSAATALVSRMAAIIQAHYPALWPETVRALLIHSADWTPAMMDRFKNGKRDGIRNLLKYCGYGVPDLDRAIWSARNSLTMIAQDSLQPYDKEKSNFKTKDMHIHSIPWPVQVLQDLGETYVEMRVTLSYFIEPNPARRGWTRRYRYASHGLRFDVKTPEENLEQFRQRINRAAHDEEMDIKSKSDAKRWDIGPDLRGLGSVHSDRWRGTAAELAARGYMAVYPVIGWWRERHHLDRWNKRARYALVISISTPEENVDLYTTVQNMISPVVEVAI